MKFKGQATARQWFDHPSGQVAEALGGGEGLAVERYLR